MLNDEDKQYLIDLAGMLQTADRSTDTIPGFPHYVNEGFKYIQISDELAKKVATNLLSIAARIA